MPGPAPVYCRVYLSDGRVLRVQGEARSVRRDMSRSLHGPKYKATVDRTGQWNLEPDHGMNLPMVNLVIPDSWTPEGGVDYYFVNALNVVEVKSEERWQAELKMNPLDHPELQ